ncbi:MAG TPA: DNA starvation/stationary phase protection protein [Vicinamibacterales bacterium]|nr:DNA starvation/stationary phase protection protein [Vicinamibacterales bacterium]
MTTKTVDRHIDTAHAGPLGDPQSTVLQPYDLLIPLPIGLPEATCREGVEQLNQLLADTVTLRDMYKKHHWQVQGPTFYELHLLFDKHAGEQTVCIDSLAERVQTLGGVSLAMGADIAETTLIARPPRGREEARAQIARLLQAHEIVLREGRIIARMAAERGDDGTNDLIVSDIIRVNETEVWFLAQHLVEAPLVHADR